MIQFLFLNWNTVSRNLFERALACIPVCRLRNCSAADHRGLLRPGGLRPTRIPHLYQAGYEALGSYIYTHTCQKAHSNQMTLAGSWQCACRSVMAHHHYLHITITRPHGANNSLQKKKKKKTITFKSHIVLIELLCCTKFII
jgi:hypothetical protein